MIKKIFISILAVVILIVPAAFAADKEMEAIIENPMVMKGIYLGMPKNQAAEILNNLKGWEPVYPDNPYNSNDFYYKQKYGTWAEIKGVKRRYFLNVTNDSKYDSGIVVTSIDINYLNNKDCIDDFNLLYKKFGEKYGYAPVQQNLQHSVGSDRKRWQYWAVWTLADGTFLAIYEDYMNYKPAPLVHGTTLSITHSARGHKQY